MKRIKKKLVAVILAVNMLVIGIFGSYQTAQAAEIVAGYGAAQILESILLSFGISIFTADVIKNGSSATWWDTDGSAALKPYYDDLEQAYEEQRFKVINGGGGQNPEPSPTPAPGNTPIPFPTTVPVPGDIPTFKDLVASALAGGAAVINMTQGAWECMGKAVSSLWNKSLGRMDSDGLEMDEDLLNYFSQTGFAYYQYRPDYGQLQKFKEGSFFVIDTGWYYTAGSEYYYNGDNKGWRLYSTIYKDEFRGGGYVDIGATNIPRFQTFAEGIEWSKKVRANADKYKKENIWVHPDLQDTYKNNGKLEYPQQAPQPLQIPSIAQLTDLANKLKTNPQQSPNSVQELIDQLKQNPQPQPTVAPNPNPDPNPNPNPNPEVTPKPDDTTTDVNPDDYKADLRLVFPFCIPFDLVHLIQAFEAEPEAPVFEFPFDLELENPWTGKKILDYHHVFKLDMSDYEPVIRIFRIFEIIFFIIGLLMITRQQMIKG